MALNPDAPFVAELLEAGAGARLTKDCAGAELVEAIRTVRSGRIYLSPGLLDVVVKDYARPADRLATERPLAPRERVILQRIAAGQTTKEIAAALGVSGKMVETHRRRIMQKLNRHSVAELTKYAVLQGLAPLDATA